MLEGIAAARRRGFPKSKIDTVVMRGVNDDELADLIEYGRGVDAEVRFIEYMDVGGATDWSHGQSFYARGNAGAARRNATATITPLERKLFGAR